MKTVLMTRDEQACIYTCRKGQNREMDNGNRFTEEGAEGEIQSERRRQIEELSSN